MCLSNMFHKFSGRMDTLTSNNNGRKMPSKGSLVCINLTSAVSIAFHFLMNHSLTQITSLDFTTQHTVDSKRVLRHRSQRAACTIYVQFSPHKKHARSKSIWFTVQVNPWFIENTPQWSAPCHTRSRRSVSRSHAAEDESRKPSSGTSRSTPARCTTKIPNPYTPNLPRTKQKIQKAPDAAAVPPPD
jgi:hypothetical protein